jgi:rod shape-determining protein MreC
MFHKNKRNKIIIYILTVVLIIIIILTSSGNVLKDFFNVFGEKIYFVKDNNTKDSFSNVYNDTLEKQIEELKKLNSISIDNYKCIYSSVIYRDPSYWYNTLTINKGLKDGIKDGYMVLTTSGLIGIIKQSLNNTSNIYLLTNVDSRKKITVGIKYKDNIVYGIISNYDFRTNELIISEITSDIIYEKNMSVVTTGFTNTFKEGMLIGNVKKIEEDNNGLSKKVIVTPSANFNNINYVCVMVKK